MAQVLSVKFARNMSRYDYYYKDDDAEIGDKCIVVSPSSGHTLVHVVDVRKANKRGDATLKPVHTLISLKAEREEAELAVKRRAAQQQLDQMLRRRMERDKYDVLVDDPEAKRLIDELKSLGG